MTNRRRYEQGSGGRERGVLGDPRRRYREVPGGDSGDPVGGYLDYPGGPGLRSRGDPVGM